MSEESNKALTNQQEALRKAALRYHEFPTPGKISVTPTKQLTNQRDLALAYTPGVASACLEIVKDPATAVKYTARGNLVGVITNGSAVLGLGNIGALASKPVMEGKAVLFKKFAGIDVFDIEINESDPEKLVEIIAALEPTFGGINLEDIKAPDCFYVERKLRDRMKIPVFHDDQHGTAIVVGAAITNGLKIVGKKIQDVKLVTSGAGAAALACLDLLVDLGMLVENIWVTDLAGVVYVGRKELMDPDKDVFAKETSARTLAEVIEGADILLGLSAGGVVSQEMVKKMAPNPLVFVLANPNPEITPADVKEVRPDAIIATGRTDYPNQVNNVLCFPFIFRGALDVGATTITREMEVAAVNAVAELAQAEQSDIVATAYGTANLTFGPEYLIPKPFDPRLITIIAPAVAKAAMDSGVATRPIHDFSVYQDQLQQFVYHSGTLMKPLFAAAKKIPKEQKRIVFCEGEDEKILRAVQVLVDENIVTPILVGRPGVIERRIERFGLRLEKNVDYTITDPEHDERYKDYWQTFYELTKRQGVTESYARLEVRRRNTLIGALMVRKGQADGLICGIIGSPTAHLHYIDVTIGHQAGTDIYAAMNALVLPDRQIFIADTHINYDPSAEQLAEITRLAAAEMRSFSITPKVALVSHSNFGSSQMPSAEKMRKVLEILRQTNPELEIEGEMHGDCALDSAVRKATMKDNLLAGEANLLVMPNIDAANISYNLLKVSVSNGVAIGPILLGAAKSVMILTPSSTVRRIVNVATLAVVGVKKTLL
jgi:malate dehydrogenase (oxaloacetate-decarboxylating)(NADP+)